MIKELYIDGYLVDIDDNFSIVRQYSSPFFSDVTQLKNNGSYSTKIPETQNNSFIMDYLEREDADTTFPYRGHVANYYVDSFPVFENAEVRVIDAFELQFVWGLNRGKYLPLFTRKLNEIVPNGTTILESDWVVPWKKSNVVYNTGKKYKYLNYISGERESEVKIIDGEEQPLTEAPEPFLSNLKEMTMHPFVKFTDILDLIIADHNTNVDNIDIVSTEFDALKTRLTNKGLILGGNKDYKEYEYLKTYSASGYSSTEFVLSDSLSYNYDLIVFNKHHNRWGDYTKFRVSQIINENVKVTALITLDVSLSVSKAMNLCKAPIGTNDREIIAGVNITSLGGGRWAYEFSAEVLIEKGYDYSFAFIEETGYYVDSGGVFKIEYSVDTAVFAPLATGFPTYAFGRYNCLMNLPDMTEAEFINQMLIMTGLFVGHDANGNMKFLSLDKFKANLLSGNIYDWSGKVSQREKSYFQFNSNAQKNWIKFANSDDRTYTAKDSIVVDDETLNTEKDLYTISFDLAEQGASGIAEFILYKQKVASSEKDGEEVKTFSNEYKSKNDVCVYDLNGKANNDYILPCDNTINFKAIAQPIPIGITSTFTVQSLGTNYIVVVEDISELDLVVGGLILHSLNSCFIYFENVIVTGWDTGTKCIYFDITDVSEYFTPSGTFDLCKKNSNNIRITGLDYTLSPGDKIISIEGLSTDIEIVSSNIDNNEFIIDSEYMEVYNTYTKIQLEIYIKGIVTAYYEVFKDIIYRPRVLDIVVKLDFLETLNIDFEKPVYISDYGKYAVLLDIKIPDDGLCNAKILLINQPL